MRLSNLGFRHFETSRLHLQALGIDNDVDGLTNSLFIQIICWRHCHSTQDIIKKYMN